MKPEVALNNRVVLDEHPVTATPSVADAEALAEIARIRGLLASLVRHLSDGAPGESPPTRHLRLVDQSSRRR